MRWWIKNWGLVLKIVSGLLPVGAMVTLTWWGLKTQDNASSIDNLMVISSITMLSNQILTTQQAELKAEVVHLRHSVETFNLKNRIQTLEKSE